jgi:cytidyltransferase-like protein
MSKIVFTNGCFDVLHAGHFNLLSYCRTLAGKNGRVIVAIDSDVKVSNDKGITRPIFGQEYRRNALESLVYPHHSFFKLMIDQVVYFNTNEELYEIIKLNKPDYIVKGSDWQGNVVGSDLAEVKLYKRDVPYSSSKIIKRITQRALEFDFRNEAMNEEL